MPCVMNERIKPKIGHRMGIFSCFGKEREREGYGFLRRAIFGDCSPFVQSFARKEKKKEVIGRL